MRFGLLLLSTVLCFQHPQSDQPGIAPKSKVWTLDDSVSGLPTAIGGDDLLTTLLRLGTQNHLPLGLVSQTREGPTLCRPTPIFQNRTERLRDLLIELNAAIPEYEAALQGGTLDVVPRNPLKGVRDLLNLRLDQFRSDPETRYMVAVNLWFWTRAKLNPDLGSAFVGGIPTSRPIEALNLRDVSVQEILNLLARSGSGGVWYVDSQNLKQLSPEMAQPFVTYGYDGDESNISSIHSCDTH